MPSAAHNVIDAAGKSAGTVGVPNAAFTTSMNNLIVSVNASGSTDSGATITAYAWNFGDSASGSGQTTTHTYSNAGSYTITLTVTDSTGATDTQTHSVTATAAAQTSGNGDPGINQTGNAGQQQSGATQYQSLSGSDMQAKATAAGTNGMSFASGTFAIPKFSGSGTSGIGVNFPTGMQSLLGAGSASTILAMPAGIDNGTHSNISSGTTSILLTQWESAPDGWVVDGINLQGTDQGTSANASVDGLWFHGLQMDNPGSGTMSNTTISAAVGNSGSPPSETFGLSLHQQAAGKTINITNCTFDGKRVSDGKLVGAAISGTNTTHGIVNFTDCLFQNSGYSAGLALWEVASDSTINLTRPVFNNCHRNLGNEAQGGTINIYDPLFDDPTGNNEDDVRITWTSNYNSGTINFYFTAQSNWTAFIANRTNKKILTQCTVAQDYGGTAGTAYGGSNDITDFCHVYIAGVEQTLSNYWTFSGQSHN